MIEKVYIVIREYLEDNGHPFAEPTNETDIKDVFANEEDASAALSTLKDRHPRDRFYVISREVIY